MGAKTEELPCLCKLGNLIEKRISIAESHEILLALTQAIHCTQNSLLHPADKQYVCHCFYEFKNSLSNGELYSTNE